jgi:muramoyltetrapeptide carboxypeptidase
MDLTLNTTGFQGTGHLRFAGNDIRDVHRQFGATVSSITKRKLNEVIDSLGKRERAAVHLEYASNSLQQLEQLATENFLTINGVNWLRRYLEALYGFCEGSGITATEGALLQLEIQTECQTIILQDKNTQEIRFIHTEEDGNYSITEMRSDPFRLVELNISGRKTTFFAYPGLCSWGPAFNIRHDLGIILMVDDLYMKESANKGPITANAMAFMALDSGDLNIVEQLLNRAKTAPAGFSGGYALHFVVAGENPTMEAVEFGSDQVSWERPTVLPDRSFFVHANCPITGSLQPTTDAGIPSPETQLEEVEIFVEMRLRHQRLEAKASGVNWLGQDPHASITTGQWLIASPEGDIGGYSDPNGYEHWEYFTGLPSKWTLSHMVGYVGKLGTTISVGRYLPPPIPGHEYSLQPRKNYPYARKRIWKEAARVQKALHLKQGWLRSSWRSDTIIPPKLYPGAEVRIIAPATSLNSMRSVVARQAHKRLEAMGLHVTYGENVYEEDDFDSSSVKSRVRDLHNAFLDPNVKAVISADGGFNSNQMLAHINWHIIKENPKILTGYSDITALQNAILTKTGLVTYSGALFWSLGIDSFFDYSKWYFEKCLFGTRPFEVHPSIDWDDDNSEDESQAKDWIGKGLVTISEGEAFGTIVGGNLSTFGLLRGTEFFPNLENSILFLEDDFEYQIHHFDRDLQALIHLPEFFGVRGLVLGRTEAASNIDLNLMTQMIQAKEELKSIPVIVNADFGHTYPKILFPIGGSAYINAQKGHPIVRILDH